MLSPGVLRNGVVARLPASTSATARSSSLLVRRRQHRLRQVLADLEPLELGHRVAELGEAVLLPNHFRSPRSRTCCSLTKQTTLSFSTRTLSVFHSPGL